MIANTIKYTLKSYDISMKFYPKITVCQAFVGKQKIFWGKRGQFGLDTVLCKIV